MDPMFCKQNKNKISLKVDKVETGDKNEDE